MYKHAGCRGGHEKKFWRSILNFFECSHNIPRVIKSTKTWDRLSFFFYKITENLPLCNYNYLSKWSSCKFSRKLSKRALIQSENSTEVLTCIRGTSVDRNYTKTLMLFVKDILHSQEWCRIEVARKCLSPIIFLSKATSVYPLTRT